MCILIRKRVNIKVPPLANTMTIYMFYIMQGINISILLSSVYKSNVRVRTIDTIITRLVPHHRMRLPLVAVPAIAIVQLLLLLLSYITCYRMGILSLKGVIVDPRLVSRQWQRRRWGVFLRAVSMGKYQGQVIGIDLWDKCNLFSYYRENFNPICSIVLA